MLGEGDWFTLFIFFSISFLQNPVDNGWDKKDCYYNIADIDINNRGCNQTDDQNDN